MPLGIFGISFESFSLYLKMLLFFFLKEGYLISTVLSVKPCFEDDTVRLRCINLLFWCFLCYFPSFFFLSTF